MSTPPPVTEPTVDAVIVGGGIAGLWLLNLLTRRGYGAVLFEADHLGGSQTLASQGMIHGGLKYALGGNLTGASEAIAGMPERWRQCLAGTGDLDLTGLMPLSDRYFMFAADSTLGRLTTFFASRSLRGRIRRLDRGDYPPALAHPGFRGVVYELNDFVLDTPALLEALRAPVADRIYRQKIGADDLELSDDACRITCGAGAIRARRLLLTAGAGTGALLARLGVAAPRMQLRPLHQVLVRHRYPHPLYAHCLTSIRRAEPRLTITSHRDGDGWLWYLGGQLAGDGANMSASAQIDHARDELLACVPWIRWDDAEFSTLRIDRAEPADGAGRRPDEAYAEAVGTAVVAWPTKLSLVPDLGDKVLALMPQPQAPLPPQAPSPPQALPPVPVLDLPRAEVGRPPWAH